MKNGLKTIFVTVDLGISIRNILRTDVFLRLKERKDLRIVIFSTIVDKDFREEFSADNVVIEPMPKWHPNVLVKLIQSMKKELWAENCGIFTYQNRRKKKNRRITRKLIIDPLRNLNHGQKILQLIHFLNVAETRFTPLLDHDLFERYAPDLVFCTTLYTKYLSLQIGAQQRRVKTLSFIQSWDNPTSKGPFPVIPDRVIVWNEILRQEVLRYHDFPAEKIYLSGVPQFDIYLDKNNFLCKRDFFRKWKLDTDRCLITYTTGSSNMLPNEHEVIQQLYERVAGNKLISPAQLLVRPHPKDLFDYENHFRDCTLMTIQRPGPFAQTKDRWNPKREDMYGLAELMCYSDVVVNVASTITIDAVCFDTPVVNVAFDGYARLEYMDSCRRYYDYDHYKNIIKTNGVKVANSVEELTDYINSYLRDPELDGIGRRKIREEQCWKLDGKSGERIANYILKYLDE